MKLSLEHLVRPSTLPATEKKPTIIMLHGYGSNEEDLFSFAPELDERFLIISAQAPINLQPSGYAWYAITYQPGNKKFTNDEQALQSRDSICHFIDEVVEHYHADPDNICLMGFSQGAILSYATALSFPKKVRQVVAMSGYVHHELLAPNYRENDFSRLRIYSSHGSVDQVVPVEWDRQTPKLLEQLAIEHQYSEFPVGHGVHPLNFEEMKTWLQVFPEEN